MELIKNQTKQNNFDRKTYETKVATLCELIPQNNVETHKFKNSSEYQPMKTKLSPTHDLLSLAHLGRGFFFIAFYVPHLASAN